MCAIVFHTHTTQLLCQGEEEVEFLLSNILPNQLLQILIMNGEGKFSYFLKWGAEESLGGNSYNFWEGKASWIVKLRPTRKRTRRLMWLQGQGRYYSGMRVLNDQYMLLQIKPMTSLWSSMKRSQKFLFLQIVRSGIYNHSGE